MIKTFKDNFKSSNLNIQLESTIAQISTNVRLQRMLWASAYIVVFYLFLVISDALDNARSDSSRVQKTLSRLEKYENQKDWEKLLQHEVEMANRLRDSLWKAKGSGLAEADFQTYLQKILQENQVEHIVLKLGEPNTNMLNQTEYWIIQAEITGIVDKARALKLISDISINKKRVKIDRFSYTPERGNRVSLLLTAYFERVS